MNQSWSELGEEIRDEVLRAIASGDFVSLNETIKKTLNKARTGNTDRSDDIIDVESSYEGEYDYSGTYRRETEARRRKAQQTYRTYTYRQNARPGGQTAQGRPYYRQYTQSQTQTQRRTSQTAQPVRPAAVKPPAQPEDPRYALVPAKRYRTAGTAMSVTGGILTVGTAIAMGVCTAVSVGLGGVTGLWIADGVLLPFLAGGITLWGKGNGRRSLHDRFRGYMAALKDRTYGAVAELARRVGIGEEKAKKDLNRMISLGWFPQGHLDDEGTTMITDDQTYAQYRIAMKQAEEKRAEEASRPAADPETEKIRAQGEENLKKLRACNDAIPGEEMSEKISRIESVVYRIYERVLEHPEMAPELRKMQEYYLPTTVKLLEAYAEMDGQPVQGENITTAKKEIEGTLDTLNTAFENLLDGLFRDAAWDVSTDISVLQTLLAQDGLMEGRKKEENKGEES